MTLRLKGWGDSRCRRCYILVMWYVDSGGLTAAGRAKREAVRFEVAEMFGQGVRPPEVARRVSRKSALPGTRPGGTAADQPWPRRGLVALPLSSAMTKPSACRPSWRLARRRTAGARTSGGPWRGSRS